MVVHVACQHVSARVFALPEVVLSMIEANCLPRPRGHHIILSKIIFGQPPTWHVSCQHLGPGSSGWGWGGVEGVVGGGGGARFSGRVKVYNIWE